MEGGLGQNSVPSSSSSDKSMILDVKPLRCLLPIFPMSSQGPSSGQYPSGFAPFFPFGGPQESHAWTDLNQHAPPSGDVPMPTPIRTVRSPLDSIPSKRGAPHGSSSKSSQRKTKKSQESQMDLCSIVGISPDQQTDGDREVVNLVLREFDALRRRISQLEDAKRGDLRAGNILMTEGVRTNMTKRVGVVPGIEIGDIFYFRMELCVVGLHAQSMGGIDSMTIKGGFEDEPLALSIVSSYEYDDHADDDDVLIYSGQSGNFGKRDTVAADQKLQGGNLALERSSRRHNEVRVIRGMKDPAAPNAKIYVYDGLYKIQDSWIEKGKHGSGVFKYKLVRVPGQLSAFSVWKSVQKWKTDCSSRTGLILSDLSSGAESIPVSLVNDVDHERLPGGFTYFHSLRYSKPFSLMQSSDGCNCTKTCVPGDLNCSCIRRNEGDFPYIGNGILVSRKPLIHECGPTCRCFPNCKNRVSQLGLRHSLEVFKTRDRGWGLRSLDPIRAGSFICEYAGEVIDKGNLNQNEELAIKDEYAFNTNRIYPPFKWNHTPQLFEGVDSDDPSEDYDIPSPLVISAKEFGNVARFMNHSCSPNVFWQPVVYEENNQSFLHIAFFSLRHIPPMTELTYDYGVSRSDHTEGRGMPGGRKKCLCGSSKCRGSFG
ncbi:histone-lysine N-methyltransferase, H3 lysine-9 specific SUVH3-like [Neltuma alba]|uniref:histone-lysine N-methyltransferase, H3 lysine-9 specific SUVH3-like n=1 Tax=Neltuma alba TaxID=207710 RepID=UPI0010A40C2B|nr:histone-lysine N-methyltransferase, H3 lysine-9 specific SUVH3-like [Prosopis alba]XP_028782338.1 histone-lysine N-methyltransferase, H3 lysine-9 specific SUVH3-like [Prosopis alba]